MAVARNAQGRERRDDPPESRPRPALPSLSDAEREFWRRAVAVERERQRCPRPAPFPFQEA